MKTVSLVQFRREAFKILRKVQRGQPVLLTYRGKAIARLEPVLPAQVSPDDPFYTLSNLATSKPVPKQKPLTNEDIDRIVYGI